MIKKIPVLFYFIIAWLVFVLSLTTWWMIFSWRLVDRLNQLVQDSDVLKHQQMLLMEGAVLIGCILLGGAGLIYFSFRERRRREEVHQFFSTFNHDLKTSISRLVLQAESLVVIAGKSTPMVESFRKNLSLLELQLDNSLQMSQGDQRRLLMQEVDLKPLIARVHSAWPEVQIQLQGATSFFGDAVILESFFKNLVGNSILHGGATEVRIHIDRQHNWQTITYNDNGKIERTSVSSLGEELQNSQKGSGLGLYLMRNWTLLLGGRLKFEITPENSLQIIIELPPGPR